jgi:putative membrane protein
MLVQMTNKIFGTLATIGALVLSPLAMAQTDAGATAPSKQDTMFVAKASAGGMTEIQASQLADSHTQSTAIKSFASTMVTDHTKAGDMLSSIAQKDGFTPSVAPMPMQQKDLSQLGKLNGAAFDKAYTAMMLKDHRETIALFKKESMAGKNDDLKSFASQTLPTLQQHMTMAKKL